MAQGVLKKFFLKIPVKNESFLPFFVLEMLQAPFISEGQKKGKPLKMLDFQGFLAEGVGFEPTWGLSPKRFSRPFDKYIISSSYGFFQGILMFQKSQSHQGFFTLNELNIDRNAPFCAKMISKKISKKERQFCKLERILERILRKKQQDEVHLKNEVLGTGFSEKERIYEIPLERHQKFTR